MKKKIRKIDGLNFLSKQVASIHIPRDLTNTIYVLENAYSMDSEVINRIKNNNGQVFLFGAETIKKF